MSGLQAQAGPRSGEIKDGDKWSLESQMMVGTNISMVYPEKNWKQLTAK